MKVIIGWLATAVLVRLEVDTLAEANVAEASQSSHVAEAEAAEAGLPEWFTDWFSFCFGGQDDFDDTPDRSASTAGERVVPPVAKVYLVGDGSAGKSNLLERMVGDEYNPLTRQSSQPESGKWTVQSAKSAAAGTLVQIVDLPGEDTHRTVTVKTFAQAHVIVLVYDVNNATTFESIEKDWYVEATQPGVQADIVLVGSKADYLYATPTLGMSPQQARLQKHVEEFAMQHRNILHVVETAKGPSQTQSGVVYATKLGKGLLEKELEQRKKELARLEDKKKDGNLKERHEKRRLKALKRTDGDAVFKVVTGGLQVNTDDGLAALCTDVNSGWEGTPALQKDDIIQGVSSVDELKAKSMNVKVMRSVPGLKKVLTTMIERGFIMH